VSGSPAMPWSLFSISPPAGKSESFAKNSGYFIRLLKYVNFQSPDTLVSFNVIRVFTSVPVDEAVQVNSDNSKSLVILNLMRVFGHSEILVLGHHVIINY
jgi:hypothetical protein